MVTRKRTTKKVKSYTEMSVQELINKRRQLSEEMRQIDSILQQASQEIIVNPNPVLSNADQNFYQIGPNNQVFHKASSVPPLNVESKNQIVELDMWATTLPAEQNEGEEDHLFGTPEIVSKNESFYVPPNDYPYKEDEETFDSMLKTVKDLNNSSKSN